MAAQGKPVLCVEDVWRNFGKRWVLCGVSFTLRQGDIHVILGHNGAGKTTLLKIILGLIAPSKGYAEIAEHQTWPRTRGQPARRCVAALLEVGGLLERLTAWENLEFMARLYGVAESKWRDRAEELLELFALQDHRDEPVAAWSAGMKRKLALARTLLPHPSVLLLDEPTAGLDAVAKANMVAAIRQAARAGAGVVLATQDLWEAQKVATHVTLLREGRVVVTGEYQEIIARAQLRKYRLPGQMSHTEVARALRCGAKLVRCEADVLGTSVLIHTGVESQAGGPFLEANGAVTKAIEIPVSLEEAYLFLDERSGRSG